MQDVARKRLKNSSSLLQDPLCCPGGLVGDSVGEVLSSGGLMGAGSLQRFFLCQTVCLSGKFPPVWQLELMAESRFVQWTQANGDWSAVTVLWAPLGEQPDNCPPPQTRECSSFSPLLLTPSVFQTHEWIIPWPSETQGHGGSKEKIDLCRQGRKMEFTS